MSAKEHKQSQAAGRGGGTRALRTKLGWGLLLAGLLAVVFWVGLAGGQTWTHARSLLAHLRALEALVEGGPDSLDDGALQEAGVHLAGIRADVVVIEKWVGPFLPAGRLLRSMPIYGGDLAAARDLLAVASGVSRAGDRIFRSLSPALDLWGEPAGPAGIGAKLLPVLVAARPELRAAQADLAAGQQARGRIELGSLSPRAAGLVEKLDSYLPWLETAVDGALLAPNLLGADGQRTYLVIAQNNQELRATGGFISGVGELRVDEGRLGALNFDDSYAVDNLEVPHDIPPADFQAVLGGQLWFFRDANWDADWPTSARRALDIYARDRGVKADGVIALDLFALQVLVDASGPLQVEGFDQAVSTENLLSSIQEAWGEPAGGSGYEWWLHRKDFMGQIAGAAMGRLVSGQDLSLAKLALALKTALDEKHILIYLPGSEASALLHRQKWDGALVDCGSCDVLLVVDSNVGFNKVDANVSRSIQFEMDLAAAEGPRARLTLTYQNRSRKPVEACLQESRYGDSYGDMIERCYWDYLRVYATQGSELLSSPGLYLPPGSLLAREGGPLPDPPLPAALEIEGRAVWNAFFALEPLGEQTLVFEYRLPDGLPEADEEGAVHYRLQVQKQAGTEAVPFELVVLLPAGADLQRTAPAGSVSKDGSTVTIDTDLRLDRAFEVVYRQGGRSHEP